MDMLKSKAKLKALKWILLKYGKIEDIQAHEVNKVFLFILEYRYAVNVALHATRYTVGHPSFSE
jgi:hypothetical protein